MNTNQDTIPFGGNLVICCSTGNGGDGRFSCLITDQIPDLNLVRSGQAFPMFIYEY
ncbi:TPA: type ISP restriction/modification enzyme, partial [Neisseria meningitidis]